LPAEIQVCAIQFSGRGDRFSEPLFTSVEPLVEGIAAELTGRLADKPFALFGHSLGALIAFELCRSLRRQRGPSPRVLFVAGRRAPGIPSARPQLHTLPDSEFLNAVQQYGGLPTEVIQEQELMDLFLPVLRADLEIDEKYNRAPEAPLECPISVLGGKGDPIVTQAELEGWSSETSHAFSLRLFEGGHFFVDSSRAALLAAIEEDIDARRRLFAPARDVK